MAVREYRPSDERGVLDLLDATYDRPRQAEEHRWKRRAEAVEFATAWIAVNDDNAVVGHWGGTPVQVSLAGRRVTAMHTGDAATASGSRRQGVFSSVGLAAHEAWAREGVAFAYALTYVKGWGSRLAHVGFTTLFPIPWWTLPLRPDQMLARRLSGASRWARPLTPLAVARVQRRIARVPPEAGVALLNAGPGDERFDRLWTSVGDRYRAAVIRNREWIDYRYFGAPGRDYQVLIAERHGMPVGYAAFRIAGRAGHRTAWLADVFAAPDDRSAGPLLAAVLRSAIDQGARDVRALIPPGTWLAATARALGFIQTRAGFDVSVVALGEARSAALANDPRQFFVGGGDFDVI